MVGTTPLAYGKTVQKSGNRGEEAISESADIYFQGFVSLEMGKDGIIGI